MKPFASLAAAFAATVAPASAWACGVVQPRPYLRASPPQQVEDDQIVAEVELDTATPISIQDQGLRFRVRWMIQGEPVESVVVLPAICSSEVPGRAAGYLVATRVRREGNTIVVNPVLPAFRHFPPATPDSTR